MPNRFDSLHNLDDLQHAIQAPRPVLVEFGAAWCAPCRRLTAALERLAPDYDLDIRQVDVEDARDIAARYQVRSVPTLLGFRDGAVVVADHGFSGEPRLRKLLAQLAAHASIPAP